MVYTVLLFDTTKEYFYINMQVSVQAIIEIGKRVCESTYQTGMISGFL